MHSVLSCLVTDVIGPATIAEDLVATVAGEYGFEGGIALREHVRAIDLVFAALNLAAGDKIAISPLSPRAYGSAIRSRELSPVFIDVIEEDATLNPQSVADLLSEEIKAVVVHAPLGRVPDAKAFYDLGIPVVFDIGEALGARETDAYLGGGADYLILPMEPEAIATTGGGTLVLSRAKSEQSALAAVAETLSVDAFLPDLNASLGLVQWREYPQALESRDIIQDAYVKSLMKGRHRTLSDPRDEECRAVPYSFPVVITGDINEVRRYARKKGVETLPAFTGRLFDEYPEAGETCPKAKSLMMGTLLFPLYPTLGKKNVQLIVKVLSTLP